MSSRLAVWWSSTAAANAEEGGERQDSRHQHAGGGGQGDGVALGTGKVHDGGKHEEAKAAEQIKHREVETVSHGDPLMSQRATAGRRGRKDERADERAGGLLYQAYSTRGRAKRQPARLPVHLVALIVREDHVNRRLDERMIRVCRWDGVLDNVRVLDYNRWERMG